MKYLISISILFFVTVVKAQNPALLSIVGHGGDHADLLDKHVVKTDDGGFIIRIASLPFTLGDLPSCHNNANHYQNLFRKYDASGTTMEWQRCYRPPVSQGDSAIEYIFPAPNGNFYTIGIHGVVGGYAKYFLRLEDAAQNQLWCGAGYGGAQYLYLETVCRADDGGFFLAFRSDYAGGDVTVHYGSNTWQDIWILKLDSLGNKVWGKTVGGTWVDVPTKILPAANGGCIVAGYSDSYDNDCVGNNGGLDGYVAKLDSSGNIVWHKCLGGPSNDQVDDAVDNGNGYLLLAGAAGNNGNYVHNHHGGYADFWLTKIDTAGNYIWDSCYGGGHGEGAKAVCQSTDGSIWMTGYSSLQGVQVDQSFGNLGDSWTIHVDNNGNFICGKVLGYTAADRGVLIQALSDGVALVGGEYRSAAPAGSDFLTYHNGNSDVFFARFGPWTTSVVNSNAEILKCRVFPNPGDKIINIELPVKDKAYQVYLYDMKGRSVYQNKIQGRNSCTISTENFARGVYNLSISDESNGKYNERIVLK